jgi:P27 family predicted phage terminase small subunit
MGARGPAPKPTALKELAGNPGKRPLNKNEPRPRVAIPPCPKWLTGVARTEFKRAAKLLVNLQVLTEADRTALAAYAHQYAKWLEAEQKVVELGAVLVSPKSGGLYINPWQGVANMALKNLRSLAAEFGMTPASRSRVSAIGPAEELSLAEELFVFVNQDAG